MWGNEMFVLVRGKNSSFASSAPLRLCVRNFRIISKVFAVENKVGGRASIGSKNANTF